MMRSVCFVDRLELEFSGNHFSHAITIGDPDNDGLNELVVGNVDGVLAIFKGDTSNKAWKKCSGLGTVACVGVGDVFNSGSNALVVINAENQFFIFLIDNKDNKRQNPQTSSGGSSSSASPSDHKSRSPRTTPIATPTNSRSMKPIHTQSLQVPNVKVVTFAKITRDGQWHVCIGHMDRFVTVYCWSKESRRIELLNKFSLTGQIGSLSVSQSSEGVPHLLISQPGGTYVPLFQNEEEEEKKEIKGVKGPGKKDKGSGFSLGEVIGQAQRRNPTSSTEVVGRILDQPNCSGSEEIPESSCSNIVALCSLNGVVRLLKDEEKLWELQVDHSLFAIGKLDVTGDGSDEIVVAAWDGTTYIVDHDRKCVRFLFDQNVCAFCCGYYGLSEGKNVPCLVYTTFSNTIYLYRDITLPTVPSSNLLLTLQNMEIPSILKEKLDAMNNMEKQKLFSKCLYGVQDASNAESLPDEHENGIHIDKH